MNIRRPIFTLCLFTVMLAGQACQTVPETNRTQILLIDASSELAMGEESYKEILSKSKISKDRDLTKKIRQIGRNIANVTKEKGKFHWEFNLIEEESPNAYCLPGGKVGIHTGIIPIAQNEAGLATIMGHEIAHAIARHGAERMSQSILIALGGELLAQGVGKSESDRQALRAAYGIGTAVTVSLPFSRQHELEADFMGLLYMARAGYDPRESVRFWKRFSDYSKKKGGGKPIEFLSTHPAGKKRIVQLEKMMPRAMEEYKKSKKMGLGLRLY